jgi:glycosyltransferase involved in cell wall biosynthesis
VHPTDDVRIFGKECRSLAMNGFDVTLIGPGDSDIVEKVRIIGVPGARTNRRIRRMIESSIRLTLKVVGRRADIYHFHDPELIVMGIVLKAIGRRVVYDVHEDLPRGIMHKHWIRPQLRAVVASVMTAIEAIAGAAFDGIVAATPTIAARFPPRKTVLIRNFPRVEEFAPVAGAAYCERPLQVAYVGLLDGTRGLFDMIEAAGRAKNGGPCPLVLAGRFTTVDDEARSRASPSWPRVAYLGWLDRAGIARVLSCVRAGIVVLHPVPSYVVSYPIKMFEYMAAGLPVIASDFPVFREILDGGACGLLVEPRDPAGLAGAIQWIFDHPAEARVIGERGRRRVETLYTWEAEESRLADFYRRLLPPAATVSR